MRVLHLDSGRDMRGGQWQALRLHRGLVERGHDSLLLAPEDSPLLAAALVEKLPADTIRPSRVRSRNFDLIHVHDARSHSVAALLARLPFVVSRRVAFPVKKSSASRWKYQRPRLFLAVSRHVAEELMRANVEESRIVVVYDGVPIPPEPAHGDAVLALDTSDSEKGTALAVQSAKLAGVELRLSSNLEADLPHARALLYLTKSEGLGSAILLGMAYGLTVIASRVGGIPELIDNGINGILVPNEPRAIAAALGRIDPTLGQAARQTVTQRFTVGHMIDATLAAYEKALAHD